jgi:hypothetical protein
VDQPTTRVPVIDGWIWHTIEYDPGALGAVNVALLPPSIVPVSNALAVNVWPALSRFVTVTTAPGATGDVANAKSLISAAAATVGAAVAGAPATVVP